MYEGNTKRQKRYFHIYYVSETIRYQGVGRSLNLPMLVLMKVQWIHKDVEIKLIKEIWTVYHLNWIMNICMFDWLSACINTHS